MRGARLGRSNTRLDGGPTLEYRILGRFEVVDGESIALGGPKQRAVLVLLLLNRGEAMPTDRMVDALWPERAPATAVKALHVYVSNLRKALGPDLLVTREGGYELLVEPGQVDADRFDDLATRGREALVRGEPELACEQLRGALALWRGRPLADFPYESFTQAEIARLDEARLSTLEDRIEAELGTGDHAGLVPELEALVADHPTRERLWGQLMVALYRSGRQADALERYQRARRALVDEFAIEPGPQLKEIERAILMQDPALDPPVRRDGPSSTVGRELVPEGAPVGSDDAGFVPWGGSPEEPRAAVTRDPDRGEAPGPRGGGMSRAEPLPRAADERWRAHRRLIAAIALLLTLAVIAVAAATSAKGSVLGVGKARGHQLSAPPSP